MAWRDWDTTNKVVVSVCVIAAIAMIATFAVLFTRSKAAPPAPPPNTARPETSAPPSPTYQCTTAEGSECTKDLAKKEAARDQVYADAEKALRTYNAELDKALQKGGFDEDLPKGLKAVLSRGMQAQELQDLQTVRNILKLYYKGSTKIKVDQSAQNPEWPSDKVIFDVCLDATKQFAIDIETDEHQSTGGFAQGTMMVVKDKRGHWVVDDKDLKKAERC